MRQRRNLGFLLAIIYNVNRQFIKTIASSLYNSSFGEESPGSKEHGSR